MLAVNSETAKEAGLEPGHTLVGVEGQNVQVRLAALRGMSVLAISVMQPRESPMLLVADDVGGGGWVLLENGVNG